MYDGEVFYMYMNEMVLCKYVFLFQGA